MSSLSLRRLLALAAFSCLFSSVYAVTIARSLHDDHDHPPLNKRLPSTWYQPRDHPVSSLFKRAPTDGNVYAQVGSSTWAAAFPKSTPDPAQLPQAWVDALNDAVAAGKIPDFPPSKSTGGNPTYPGLDPNSDQVCSTTYKCRKNPENIYDAPDGILGVSFDDGPLPSSDKLYDYLKENNQHATHFFIGTNILNNPKEFSRAFDELQDDIAVHTWTHPYMTTLDNMAVLGQLGWTMEIIHNSTGGRIPKYWRPPFGDSDNRVNAIAKEVFGLTTVIWNQDTEDWSLTTGGTTPEKVNASLTKWLTGPKSPGLIILEHELSDQSVQAFIDAYPVMKSNGWNVVSLAQIDGGSAYQNSDGSTGNVNPGTIVLNSQANTTSSSAPPSAAQSTASSSKSSDGASPTGATLQNSGASTTIPCLAGWQAHALLASGFFMLLSSLVVV